MLWIIRWILATFYPGYGLFHPDRTFRRATPKELDAMIAARKGIVRVGTPDELDDIKDQMWSSVNSKITGGIDRVSQGVTDRGYVDGEPAWRRTRDKN